MLLGPPRRSSGPRSDPDSRVTHTRRGVSGRTERPTIPRIQPPVAFPVARHRQIRSPPLPRDSRSRDGWRTHWNPLREEEGPRGRQETFYPPRGSSMSRDRPSTTHRTEVPGGSRDSRVDLYRTGKTDERRVEESGGPWCHHDSRPVRGFRSR